MDSTSEGVYMLWKSSSCFMNPGFGSQTPLLSLSCRSASIGDMWYFCMRKAITIVAERDLPMALLRCQ